jgi:hypothetical protein
MEYFRQHPPLGGSLQRKVAANCGRGHVTIILTRMRTDNSGDQVDLEVSGPLPGFQAA